MKKVVAIVGVLFSIVVPVQSHAADAKSLVIIDSYFDSRISGATIVCRQNLDCSATVSSIPTSLSSPVNHGDLMVEVAKKQSNNINIIALRSAYSTKTSVNEMSGVDFLEALNWVNNNSSNVGAVSISRYFNAPSGCLPSSVNAASVGGVTVLDKKIRDMIAILKVKGIPVFASTGNTSGKAVDYPACILDTNSVSTGALNKLGGIVSLNAFDINTDYFASASIANYSSPVFGLIPQTTSSGTVAVAAKYISGTALTKLVQINQ